MFHRYKSISRQTGARARSARPTARALSDRRALTLVELLVAMTIIVMVVGALGGLARTVQQGFEYSEGYGVSTQHARVVLDRIAQNVCQATANKQFPGGLVVAETVNSYRYPDTLVLWRPSGTAADPTGLPRYSELIVYCPNPGDARQLVEMTFPNDTRAVPAYSDDAGWQTALSVMKKSSGAKIVVLTDLLRACSIDASGGTSLRGAARFEVRLRPSATDWANYESGSVAWMNLPWPQGIYGTQNGLRQVWVRMELQLTPGTAWIESNPDGALAIPYLSSAALYYDLPHP